MSEDKRDPYLDMPDDEAAEIVAAKQAAGEARAWGPFKKASTEIPERMVGSEFAILEPRLGETDEDTIANILAFCAPDEQGRRGPALRDTFVSAQRLDNQKTLKGYFIPDEGEEPLDTATLQEISNRHQVTAASRGRGRRSSAKARAERAEAKASLAAQSMEEMLAQLAEHDPEAAEQYRERLEALRS